MNLLIMGPAGSGKGTMSAKIVQVFNIPHISTGDMFRQAMADKTPVGQEAKAYIDAGRLVPNEVTDKLVKERLSMADCRNGFLLDGYPRNLDQANALENICKELGKSLDAVINLEVEEDELIKRITGRRICKDCGAIYHIHFHPSKVDGVCDECGGELYQRKDDTVEEFKVRYDIYKQETLPVIEFYRNEDIVYDINAAQETKDVLKDIEKLLEDIK